MALADDLKAAYLAGDYSTVNSLLSKNGITAADAASYYQLPTTSLANMRAAGVVFSGDQLHGSNPPVTPPVTAAPTVVPMQAGQMYAPMVLPPTTATASATLTGLLANPMVLIAGAALAAFLLLRK